MSIYTDTIALVQARLNIDKISYRAAKFVVDRKIQSLEELKKFAAKEFRFLKQGNFGRLTHNELRAICGLPHTKKAYLTIKDQAEMLQEQVLELQMKVLNLENELQKYRTHEQ